MKEGEGSVSAVESAAVTLNAIVDSKMRMAQRRGRGFVLDLAESAGLLPPVDSPGGVQAGTGTQGRPGLQISVLESLPPVDEYEAPVSWRNHTLEDADSLVTYARRYSDPEKGLILYNDQSVALSLDETRERGIREMATLNFRYSPEWNAWCAIFAKDAIIHRDLLKHLLTFQQNMVEVKLLEKMRAVKATAVIKQNSELRVNDLEVGVSFQATAGDELVAFPRSFKVKLPILDIDVADEGAWKTFEVRVEVMLPQEPREVVRFQLIAPTLLAVRRARINEECGKIREALAGNVIEGQPAWTVIRGAFGEKPREVGREPEQNAFSYEESLDK